MTSLRNFLSTLLPTASPSLHFPTPEAVEVQLSPSFSPPSSPLIPARTLSSSPTPPSLSPPSSPVAGGRKLGNSAEVPSTADLLRPPRSAGSKSASGTQRWKPTPSQQQMLYRARM